MNVCSLYFMQLCVIFAEKANSGGAPGMHGLAMPKEIAISRGHGWGAGEKRFVAEFFRRQKVHLGPK